MEITTQKYKHCDLLSVQGKVDSFTAPDLTKAIDAVNHEGQFKIVLDLGKLEYMSSAGFRALLLGQRNCKRYNRGEVVLAAVRQFGLALKYAHDSLKKDKEIIMTAVKKNRLAFRVRACTHC